MFTAVFYAQLWRRSGVVTDAEFITLRYAGKQAYWLKKFKAIYLGIGMNAVILAWVNLALMAILEVFFDLQGIQLYGFTAFAMLLVAAYSAFSGLMGVALTDAFQFFIALVGCIVLAVLVVNSDKIGGITELKKALPEHSLSILPSIGESSESKGLSMGLASFIAIAGWYGGRVGILGPNQVVVDILLNGCLAQKMKNIHSWLPSSFNLLTTAFVHGHGLLWLYVQ